MCYIVLFCVILCYLCYFTFPHVWLQFLLVVLSFHSNDYFMFKRYLFVRKKSKKFTTFFIELSLLHPEPAM